MLNKGYLMTYEFKKGLIPDGKILVIVVERNISDIIINTDPFLGPEGKLIQITGFINPKYKRGQLLFLSEDFSEIEEIPKKEPYIQFQESMYNLIRALED